MVANSEDFGFIIESTYSLWISMIYARAIFKICTYKYVTGVDGFNPIQL